MKKNMYITILQGMAVTAAFLITEIVLNWLGAFDGAVRLYLVDISLRLIFGTIALVLLADNFKKQRNEHSVKALFTNMISKRTYIFRSPSRRLLYSSFRSTSLIFRYSKNTTFCHTIYLFILVNPLCRISWRTSISIRFHRTFKWISSIFTKILWFKTSVTSIKSKIIFFYSSAIQH